jgi:hypothetical protein
MFLLQCRELGIPLAERMPHLNERLLLRRERLAQDAQFRLVSLRLAQYLFAT